MLEVKPKASMVSSVGLDRCVVASTLTFEVLAENQDHSIEIFKSFLVVLEKNISKPKVLEVAAAVCCQLYVFVTPNLP